MPDKTHSEPLVQQAKDFGFGEEQAMLRDSVRKFFQDNLPVDKLHALVASINRQRVLQHVSHVLLALIAQLGLPALLFVQLGVIAQVELLHMLHARLVITVQVARQPLKLALQALIVLLV